MPARDPLPPPLTVIQRDYRTAQSPPATRRTALRVVQWNVERCYKLRGIIEELRALNADVVALQEVDVGCERSDWVDGVEELGRALGLNCAFVAEFEELHSALRSPSAQGGGVHGQAVLSRFDFTHVWPIVHSHQPVDWEAEGEARREPRRGKRVALAATVATPDGPLLVYSLHLEVFAGITGRLLQFTDVLQDCSMSGRPSQQIIAGDLNTMAHSIARLSPTYCCDSFRWRSFGQTEARFWAHNVFAVTNTPEAAVAVARGHEEASSSGGRVSAPSPPLPLPNGACNARLAGWRMPKSLCDVCVNPGFVDPWCPDRDWTLDNPKYWGLMKGKLDWLLLRNLRVVSKSMGNHAFEHSDHKWLCCDVDLN